MKKTNPSPLCNGKYISDLEFIVYVRGKGTLWNNSAPLNVKYKEKVYSIVSSKQRNHPTEKPLKLIEELVELHTLENKTVLDPFMSSGTTGVACKNLNRKFIGIELDENYFKISEERKRFGDKHMSKILRTFINVVDADCESFGGIMDETNEEELEKCSTEELGKILAVLKSSEKMIEEMIIRHHLDESYEKGFEDGKKFLIDSDEEDLI